jgi:hypothetical protein
MSIYKQKGRAWLGYFAFLSLFYFHPYQVPRLRAGVRALASSSHSFLFRSFHFFLFFRWTECSFHDTKKIL